MRGVPGFATKAIEATRKSLEARGYTVEAEAILLRLLKRKLSYRGVAGELARIEDDIIAEQKQEREAEARRLEERAREIRRGA